MNHIPYFYDTFRIGDHLFVDATTCFDAATNCSLYLRICTLVFDDVFRRVYKSFWFSVLQKDYK